MNADEVLDMTLKQFFSGLTGKYEYDEEKLEADKRLLFSALRFNSSNISAGLSEKLHKQLVNQKFPWEQQQIRTDSGFISYDAVKSSLDQISE